MFEKYKDFISNYSILTYFLGILIKIMVPCSVYTQLGSLNTQYWKNKHILLLFLSFSFLFFICILYYFVCTVTRTTNPHTVLFSLILLWFFFCKYALFFSSLFFFSFLFLKKQLGLLMKRQMKVSSRLWQLKVSPECICLPSSGDSQKMEGTGKKKVLENKQMGQGN